MYYNENEYDMKPGSHLQDNSDMNRNEEENNHDEIICEK